VSKRGPLIGAFGLSLYGRFAGILLLILVYFFLSKGAGNWCLARKLQQAAKMSIWSISSI
jgi:hypothetical protein